MDYTKMAHEKASDLLNILRGSCEYELCRDSRSTMCFDDYYRRKPSVRLDLGALVELIDYISNSMDSDLRDLCENLFEGSEE